MGRIFDKISIYVGIRRLHTDGSGHFELHNSNYTFTKYSSPPPQEQRDFLLWRSVYFIAQMNVNDARRMWVHTGSCPRSQAQSEISSLIEFDQQDWSVVLRHTASILAAWLTEWKWTGNRETQFCFYIEWMSSKLAPGVNSVVCVGD